MTTAQETEFPYRIADRLNQGWLTRGDGRYEGFDPSKRPGSARLEERPLAEIEAEFGPWRPVLPLLGTDHTELVAAFDLAGRKTIGSVASALETVFHEARGRFESDPALKTSSDYGYAVRTLTAGRPGSWEASSIIHVVHFGNDLNLHPYKSSLPVETMRATGPNPKRVHLEARDRIAAVLRRWTNSPDRYTEVPETLAGVISVYADEHHGQDGWKRIADQWLQPAGLAKQTFTDCYHLLYNQSTHFNPDLLG
ncbi:hypothetical protein ABT324_28195 [Saccharopolyspora sp. NPDC000359]|uniref:hypothetical protein n=1 Tax=Saccharopolyspora sp. NPDC000359 TaxID=3154251 RepID=UPI00331A8ACD